MILPRDELFKSDTPTPPLAMIIIILTALIFLSRSVLADTTFSFSQETHTLRLTEIIAEGEVYAYTNVRIFDSIDVIDNKGGLQAYALDGASISFRRYTNNFNAWTTISGAGHLTLNTRRLFSNLVSSSFQVHSEGVLRFNVDESDSLFMNRDDFALSTASRFQGISRNLVNSGLIKLTTKDGCRLIFDQIVNLERIEIESHSINDFLSFDALLNGGQFIFLYGPHYGTSMEARGHIENPGVMEIYGSGGRGEFTHTKEISNDGLLCFKYTHMLQTAGIKGTGCWVLTDWSYLLVDGNEDFAPTQKLVIGDCSASIRIRAFGERGNVYDVYGFLTSSMPIQSMVSLEGIRYDPLRGCLKVAHNSLHYAHFDIGMGFDENKFLVYENVVSYIGRSPPEKPIPSNCKCSNLKKMNVKT